MYYLGIDGGGTKTKFIVCDEKGNVIQQTTLPTCHYLQVGLDGLTNTLNQGIEDLCKLAKITREDIANCFIGDPGYGDVESEMPAIESAAKKALKNIPFTIGNDGENALAGALCGKDGINIICGTGSIGFGYNSILNKSEKAGGWAHQIGSDEASGYWLSYHLLHEFTRQSDGRDPKTPLYETIQKHLNLQKDGDIISVVVEEWNADRTKIASLSILIEDLYQQKDAYVYKLLDQAGKELADIAKAVYSKLEFHRPVPVSYTGGVFQLGSIILDPFSKYLDPNKFELVKPIFEPDKGSLLIALRNDKIAIDDTIIQNLKKS